MKVPFSSTTTTTTQTTSSPSPKPLNSTTASNPAATVVATNTLQPAITSCTYEPTSVLDLQSSPGHVHCALPPPPTSVPDLLSASNSPPSLDLDNLDGWDSILTELGLNDDNDHHHSSSAAPTCTDPHLITSLPLAELIHPSQPLGQTSLFPLLGHGFHQTDQSNLGQDYGPTLDQPDGFDFIDDLIRAAQFFESNDSHNVHLILSGLNHRLTAPVGKPVQRAAFYFKEALNSLVRGQSNRSQPVRLSNYEIVQIIRSYKVFFGISPVPLFSTFAANQAIIDSLSGTGNGIFLHVVDFDVGFGSHWASLLREIADKNSDHPRSSIVRLRITAIVPEEFSAESKLIRENLHQFAADLGIEFQIDYVLIRSFEISSFKSIRFLHGEILAVHLSPSLFRRLGSRNTAKFLSDLRILNPQIVIIVDKDVGIEIGSFSLNFVASIEFYAAMMESLEAGIGGGGGGGEGEEWVRRIEMTLLKPRIAAAVEAAAAAGRRGTAAVVTWREAMVGCGAKAVGPSQYAEFQAECLLRKMRVGGFHVAKRQGELLLCWQGRPLVATSAWTF